jgi:hypothetical protein
VWNTPLVCHDVRYTKISERAPTGGALFSSWRNTVVSALRLAAHEAALRAPLEAIQCFGITMSSPRSEVTRVLTACYGATCGRADHAAAKARIESQVEAFLLTGTVPDYVLQCCSAHAAGELTVSIP